jgi:Ni,Fe-hydrogenase I large subunit
LNSTYLIKVYISETGTIIVDDKMKSVVIKTARAAVLTTVILGSGMPLLRADSDNSKMAIDQQTVKVISELIVLKREEAIERINKELKKDIGKASIQDLETFASRLKNNTIEELNKKTSDAQNGKDKKDLDTSLDDVVGMIAGVTGIMAGLTLGILTLSLIRKDN